MANTIDKETSGANPLSLAHVRLDEVVTRALKDRICGSVSVRIQVYERRLGKVWASIEREG